MGFGSDLKAVLRRVWPPSRTSFAPAINAMDAAMDLDDLARSALQLRRVDAVRLGDYVAFFYKGDSSYERLPPELKGIDIGGLDLPLWKPEPPKSPADFISSWTPDQGATELLLAYMLRAFGERLAIVDVGCQYGLSTMQLYRKAMALGFKGKMHAFDCGIARNLAPLNFENNGFADHIEFHPMAAGSVDRWLTMHSRFDFTADNRVCNRGDPSNILELSEPVRGVTLDRHLGSPLDFAPLYAKIDTQGNEPRVMAGMKRWLERGETALCLEFTPEAYRTMMDPAKFTQELLETHVVFDVGQLGESIIPVEQARFADLMERVASYDYNWTDLMAFDRRLPFADELERQLKETR